MSNAILLVDDDANILAAHRRTLRQFDIETAASASDALSLLSSGRRFAVVVADMHMPRMSGVQLLARIREAHPKTVRVMLTGDGEIRTAIDAVNEGHVFRFLMKPCPTPALVNTITAALEQYRLLTAEQELLEQTLSGTIRVLTEVLSVVNPVAFSRTLRIRKHVQQVTEWLHLPDAWQYEVAAMLSQLGCISLPPDVLEAVYAGRELPASDQQRFALHASIAHDLLANIPRLDGIARMIARQHKPRAFGGTSIPIAKRDPIDIGAALLAAAIEFERLVAAGSSEADAAGSLREQPKEFDPVIVMALEAGSLGPDLPVGRVAMAELALGMVLAEDVHTHNGLLLVGRGTEVTPAVLVRLGNFMRVGSIPEQVDVVLPSGQMRQEDVPIEIA
jgi:response regulator RpfG family c-di-GMP phosphodiesterase